MNTERPDIILPNTGTAYDPSVAQDHTGQQFQTGLRPPEFTRRDPKFDAALLMRKPAWHKCPTCGSVENYRFLVESDPMGDGLMQIVCTKCNSMSPVMALGQPQVNEYLAQRLGLTIPDLSFDLDIDLGGD